MELGFKAEAENLLVKVIFAFVKPGYIFLPLIASIFRLGWNIFFSAEAIDKSELSNVANSQNIYQ